MACKALICVNFWLVPYPLIGFQPADKIANNYNHRTARGGTGGSLYDLPSPPIRVLILASKAPACGKLGAFFDAASARYH